MKNVGLIGYGYWGKILHSKLDSISKVKFICKSKDNYINKLDLVDWVFIATPDKTHYEITKSCIENGKNVFCEKPLTLTLKKSKNLFKLAETCKVKLYVDDVFNYREETKYLHSIINDINIRVMWNTFTNKNFLYRLMYHDIYLLYPVLKDGFDVNWPKINNIYFDYEISSEPMHIIGGINFNHNENQDALKKMLYAVLNDNVNYDYNKKITLYTNNILDKVSKEINL